MGMQRLKLDMDREKYRRDKTEYDAGVKVAETMSEYVNSMSVNPAGFVDTITRQHRTLQQSSMRLMLECIWRWSEADSDMRNEGTVKLCKRIRTELGLYYEGKPLLPFV